MIIPSIDLMDGQAVQLVGGKEKVLEAGDPRPLAKELAQATAPEQVAAEAADLMYFAMVALTRAGVPLVEVERELDRRALKVSRRPGNAKS